VLRGTDERSLEIVWRAVVHCATK